MNNYPFLSPSQNAALLLENKRLSVGERPLTMNEQARVWEFALQRSITDAVSYQGLHVGVESCWIQPEMTPPDDEELAGWVLALGALMQTRRDMESRHPGYPDYFWYCDGTAICPFCGETVDLVDIEHSYVTSWQCEPDGSVIDYEESQTIDSIVRMLACPSCEWRLPLIVCREGIGTLLKPVTRENFSAFVSDMWELIFGEINTALERYIHNSPNKSYLAMESIQRWMQIVTDNGAGYDLFATGYHPSGWLTAIREKWWPTLRLWLEQKAVERAAYEASNKALLKTH